jgi:type I restriction enzyme S subunit
MVTVPIPLASEQNTIATFLDHQTAKIDALIAEQQRLIELLQEKRQAVISHAVTKGLNPTAPMKDSGVEWLGEVPEHWETKRLKDIADVIDCRNKTPDYVDDGQFLVVRTTNIKNRQLVLEDAKYTDLKNFNTWTQRGIPRPGSIFFTREAPTGETALVPEGIPLCMGQRMVNIDPKDETLTGFTLCFLQSACLSRYIEACSMGSTVAHLRVPQVENLPIPVPPVTEQSEIVKRVRRLDTTFDEAVGALSSSTELLRERRSALISAAVTGQIDVRGLVTEAVEL